MTEPQLLDLFCGEGGAARGYIRAGFKVTGIDSKRSVGRYYPGMFVHGDWREQTDLLREQGYKPDLVHASAPCQLYSITNAARQADYPDLVGPVREYLLDWGVPFVMENVPRSPLRQDAVLCGTRFGLIAIDPATGLKMHLKRHRIFEAHGFTLRGAACFCKMHKKCGYIVGGVYGGGRTDLAEARNVRHGGYTPKDKATRMKLMGIREDDNMTLKGLSESIPPAYAHWIGQNWHLRDVR